MFIFKPRFVAIILIFLAFATVLFAYYYRTSVKSSVLNVVHREDAHEHEHGHEHFYPNTELNYETHPFGAAVEG